MGTVISLPTSRSVKLPTTISGVLDALDDIIEWALIHGSPLGYFPALYRKVTARVKDAITADHFDDGTRMDRLDVLFANRYLEAFYAYRAGEPCSSSWKRAFDAAENGELLVIQHLLLGMNAHINLDLGIAAAAVAPGTEIADLQDDFLRINGILASLVDEVESEIARVSPMFGLLDWLGGRSDERTVDFGMQAARDAAWIEARRFAAIPRTLRHTQATILDEQVAKLAKLVEGRSGWVRKVCRLVHRFESRNVRKNILVLR